MSDDIYKVGYKKPPEASRFQKGVSGNPRGRPKKKDEQATITEKMLKELQHKVFIRENGKIIKVTKIDAIIKNLLASAMKGDPKAISLIMKLFHINKPPQKEDDKPTHIRVSWQR